jgi:hypothetical protein
LHSTHCCVAREDILNEKRSPKKLFSSKLREKDEAVLKIYAIFIEGDT